MCLRNSFVMNRVMQNLLGFFWQNSLKGAILYLIAGSNRCHHNAVREHDRDSDVFISVINLSHELAPCSQNVMPAFFVNMFRVPIKCK